MTRNGCQVRSELTSERTVKDRVQRITFDGEVLWCNQFDGSRFSEDDVAVVGLLADMTAWCPQEGPAPYPLDEGCQDHLISLAIEESIRTGRRITTGHQPWPSAAGVDVEPALD